QTDRSRAAIQQHERRSGAGVLLRRHHGGHYHRAVQAPVAAGDRPQLSILVQGTRRRRTPHRHGAARRLHRQSSVRKIGPGVRITAHLIETEGGQLVWAEQYDRELEEIFELQDEITRTIAARIEPGVGTAERLRAERKPREALQAWDLFHLGLMHFYKFAAEDNRGAQRLLRRAASLDPKLAQAFAFLSYAVVLSMLYFDTNADDESLNEAESLAKKGVELDD